MKHLTGIFIHKNGHELGPFTEREVRRHWANGVVDSTDHAWHEGLDEWVMIKDLFGTPPAIEDQSSRIPKRIVNQ